MSHPWPAYQVEHHEQNARRSGVRERFPNIYRAESIGQHLLPDRYRLHRITRNRQPDSRRPERLALWRRSRDCPWPLFRPTWQKKRSAKPSGWWLETELAGSGKRL